MLAAFAWVILLGLPLAVMVCLAGTPEPLQRSTQRLGLTAGWRGMMANGPFSACLPRLP